MPSPRKRPPPADFDVIFVEHGRLECESWYRARRTTVTRWLEERGRERLLSLRASYWRYVRRRRRQPQPPRREASISLGGQTNVAAP